MFRVGLFLQDETLPRTEYWERFLRVVRASGSFSDATVDLIIPQEDMAIETNWPRYGDPASAYVRGASHDFQVNGQFRRYLARIIDAAKANRSQKILYVNMHPFIRVPIMLRQQSNVIVADISLAQFERSLNPNTISMAALPIIVGHSVQPGPRPILASFQGVNSHPVRQSLHGISNGQSIMVNFVDRVRHVGKIDAVSLKGDNEYEKLLLNSTFAFVPRGDALFSYRLLEVMSFGCIPIILSDGWTLLFDRTVRWEKFCLQLHAEAIPQIPQILSSLTSGDIQARQQETLIAYQTHLSSLEKIVVTTFQEAEVLCRQP
jgi:hypothetical protein